MTEQRRRTIRILLALGGLSLAAAALVMDRLGGVPQFGARQAALLAAGLAAFGASFVPRLWGRLALGFASILVTLGMAEVALRLAAAEHFAPILAHDPLLHYKPIPGAAHYFDVDPANGGGKVLVRINQAGYRGDELDPAHTRPRVVVYGDSNVIAEFSATEKTFPVQLARQLGARGLPVEAVNAGVSGYGPDQAALRLQHEIATLRPELVVMVVFASNDYGDLIRNKLFTLDPQGRLVRRDSTLAPGLRRGFDSAIRSPMVMRVASRAWLGLQGRRQSANTPEDFLKAAADDWRGDPSPTVTNLLNDYWDADIALEPDGASARHKVRLMSEVIAQMKATATRGGSRLALVVIPSPIDALPDNDLLNVDAARHPRYRRDALVAPLLEAARAHGVPCVDLYAAFTAGDTATYYRRRDDHWSDRGQALAAELTARLVLEQGLLRPR